jgi:hypothetical protein
MEKGTPKMNIKKFSSTILITVISLSNLYAEPCVNCVATILKSNNHKTSTTTFKTLQNKEENSTLISIKDSLNNDDLIPLDNNEEPSDITIIVDKTANILDSNILEEQNQTLYACNNNTAKILVCDTVSKVCECV